MIFPITKQIKSNCSTHLFKSKCLKLTSKFIIKYSQSSPLLLRSTISMNCFFNTKLRRISFKNVYNREEEETVFLHTRLTTNRHSHLLLICNIPIAKELMICLQCLLLRIEIIIKIIV